MALWVPICTPHLESLTVVCRTDGGADKGNGYDETEGFYSTYWGGYLSDESFIFHFTKNNPQLLELDLDFANLLLSYEQWTTILGALPNLRRLRIGSGHLNANSLSALHSLDSATLAEGGAPYHCPVLTHLVIENDLSLKSNWVRDIVAARNAEGVGAATKLRSVIL